MTLDGTAIILVLILPLLPLYLGHILSKLMSSSFFLLLGLFCSFGQTIPVELTRIMVKCLHLYMSLGNKQLPASHLIVLHFILITGLLTLVNQDDDINALQVKESNCYGLCSKLFSGRKKAFYFSSICCLSPATLVFSTLQQLS